jgi:uncharacterized protein (DUF983 family)
MSKIKNILGGKCPKCNKGDVFDGSGNILLLRSPKMHDTCSHCQHKFEIEPGFFFGAMYVSYGMIVAEMVAIFIIANSVVESSVGLLIVVITSIVLLSFFNFKYSRLIWMYMFTKKDVEEPAG